MAEFEEIGLEKWQQGVEGRMFKLGLMIITINFFSFGTVLGRKK